MSPCRDRFSKGLDAFLAPFEHTLEFLRRVTVARSDPEEAIILACARLDSLANAAYGYGTSTSDAFTKFVIQFGGQGSLLNQTSVGDLYHELAFHLWLTEGIVNAPGRLHQYSEDSAPMFRFIDASMVPLTQDAIENLLRRVMRALRQEFRVIAGQSKSKPVLANSAFLTKRIESIVKIRGLDAGGVAAAFRPLPSHYQVARVLYRRYRCEAIHGSLQDIDRQKVFDASDPYWAPFDSPFLPRSLRVEFPLASLVRLLANCIRYYREAILKARLMPQRVYWQAFGDDGLAHLQFLDESTLEPGADLHLRV